MLRWLRGRVGRHVPVSRRRAEKHRREAAAKAERREALRVLKMKRHWAKMAKRREAQLPDMKAGVARLMSRPEGLPLDRYADPETDRLTSQHGEDGLTVELFRRIGIDHRRCVEIGCGSNGGNAGVLVAGLDFNALLIDGDEELVEIAREYFSEHGPRIEHAWVDRDSVNGLLAEYGFDHDLDYLGIDLDGVDFWIWETLQVRPRMVICEYNPFFGPDASVTIPYVPGFVRKARDESGNFIHPKGYYGASLRALRRLGRRKGYRLVATAPGSENAYFLRDDVSDGLTEMSAEAAWRPRTKGKKATPYRPELLEAIQKEGVIAFYEKRGARLTAVD